MRRLLRPRGALLLAWNNRDQFGSPEARAIEDIIDDQYAATPDTVPRQQTGRWRYALPDGIASVPPSSEAVQMAPAESSTLFHDVAALDREERRRVLEHLLADLTKTPSASATVSARLRRALSDSDDAEDAETVPRGGGVAASTSGVARLLAWGALGPPPGVTHRALSPTAEEAAADRAASRLCVGQFRRARHRRSWWERHMPDEEVVSMVNSISVFSRAGQSVRDSTEQRIRELLRTIPRDSTSGKAIMPMMTDIVSARCHSDSPLVSASSSSPSDLDSLVMGRRA